ncbi:MAG: hypothetical protein ACXABY_20885 [Candidatus Thorarchaeota archaeon]|jgi:hypothetical protein
MTEKDAKLTTAQRKKLKGSTFCGPNRSFPVPDCAHVTAARRLIGRAKVSSSTKSRILSCVSRKAKALGCGGSDASDEEIEKLISSEEFEATHELITWLEEVEDTSVEQKADQVKELLAGCIILFRNARLNTDKHNAMIDVYISRDIDSLLDTFLDELHRPAALYALHGLLKGS